MFRCSDAGSWRVSYSVPVWNGQAVAGALRIDVKYSTAVRAAFRKIEKLAPQQSCWNCGLDCHHSYYTSSDQVGHERVCLRYPDNCLLSS